MFDVHTIRAAAYSVAVLGDEFVYQSTNQACLDLTGVTKRVYEKLRPQDIFSPEVADAILARYRQCRDTGQAVSYLADKVVPRGGRTWRTTLFPVADATGTVAQIVGICVDATEETRAVRASADLNQTLSMALTTVDGGFWVYELATEEFETSQSLAELLAGPGHRMLSLAEYCNHIHADDLRDEFIFRPKTDISTVDFRAVAHDGRTLWLRSRRRIVRAEDGSAVRVVGLVSNVTRDKAILKTLSVEASTDSLTSVRNRRAFEKLATTAFRRAGDARAGVGVLIVDLDGFKAINDRFGHRAGDILLRQVARRLARRLRKGDMLARFGGDEFAVLIADATAETCRAAAARLMGAFDKPYVLAEEPVLVGASIGSAVSGADDGRIDTVIDRADQDLYAIKRGRHSQIV